MNIYLLSQNTCQGYDTYDSCVVVANNEEDAKNLHPQKYCLIFDVAINNGEYNLNLETQGDLDSWPSKDKVNVQYIGLASDEYTEAEVILSSFNAG